MNMLGEGFRNRRRASRAPVVLPASVVTMSAYRYLELVNLSPTGAKLRGSPVPDVGQAAMFRLEGFQQLCKVVWAKDDLCGVRFDEPMPADVLQGFRQAGSPAMLDMLTPAGPQPADEWNSAAN